MHNFWSFYSGRFRGPFDCLKTIYKEGGIRGCYKGIVPQGFRQVVVINNKIMNFFLCRDVKASGLYFLIYSYSLERMKEGERKRENTGAEIFLAGGLAGRMMMMIQLPLTSS